MSTPLIVILILILIGALPNWATAEAGAMDGRNRRRLRIIVIVLALMGRL